MVIKTVSFEVIDLGKLMKKSKKKFAWKFAIDGVPNHVELIVSFYSGKKVVIHNGVTIYEGKKKMDHSFSFPFQIEVNMCNITQKGEHYELRINNQSFDQLYEQQIQNPIKDTQTKSAVRIDPTTDPRHRTTQILLQEDGGKPGFKDALATLKGVRPAAEQAQKSAPVKQVQQGINKNNANSMSLMDYQFDFGGSNNNAATQAQGFGNMGQQGNQGFGNMNQGFGNTNNNNNFGGFGNNQPNNNANNLGNLDWLGDMSKPTTSTQPNANTFGQFEMRGNQPKLTNEYIQPTNYKQDEFANFNNFAGFGGFDNANQGAGPNNANNANFGNFGNFGGNPNQNASSPNLAQKTISLGFDNKPVQTPQMQQQQNNAKREKEMQKERERQEKEAQKERERLEKQAKKAAKDLSMKDKQQSPPVNTNPASGFQSSPPQNNNTSPPQQQSTVPTYKKPTLSQLVGIDTSKLSGIAGTTKKSRAIEEATQPNEVENQQNYANTGNYGNDNNYGGGYDNNNYGNNNNNYGYANNNNYGYTQNY